MRRRGKEARQRTMPFVAAPSRCKAGRRARRPGHGPGEAPVAGQRPSASSTHQCGVSDAGWASRGSFTRRPGRRRETFEPDHEQQHGLIAVLCVAIQPAAPRVGGRFAPGRSDAAPTTTGRRGSIIAVPRVLLGAALPGTAALRGHQIRPVVLAPWQASRTHASTSSASPTFDEVALLRAGAMPALFDQARAPSSIETWLRACAGYRSVGRGTNRTPLTGTLRS